MPLVYTNVREFFHFPSLPLDISTKYYFSVREIRARAGIPFLLLAVVRIKQIYNAAIGRG